MKKNRLIDTNILIRYLTNDTPSHAQAVETLIRNAPKRSLILSDAILIEVVFVLLSVYELPKTELIDKMNVIIASDVFLLNRALWSKVFDIYSRYGISIVDSYMCAVSGLKKLPLLTFDKKLRSVSGSIPVEP